MSARSLNKAQLIGNLTRDPELRYTPQGTAVCTFGIATNRGWTTDSGEKKEATEFHRAVAWNKLAELCSQLLQKGRKVFVEGRLSTRKWTAADGTPRTTTEVVVDDMILLDRKPKSASDEGVDGVESYNQIEDNLDEIPLDGEDKDEEKKVQVQEQEVDEKDTKKEKKDEEKELSADDIPF